jgi:hypothetical protein
MQNALFAGLAHTISSAAQHLSMKLTHPQNVLKKRENLNMSDDLKARLRSTGGDACRCGTPVCLEAADRIEQLEAALRAIIVHCEIPEPPNAEALKLCARAALGEKNNE